MCEICVVSTGIVSVGLGVYRLWWNHGLLVVLRLVGSKFHASAKDQTRVIGGPRRVDHQLRPEAERPGLGGAQLRGPKAVRSGLPPGLRVVNDRIDHALPRLGAPERVAPALGSDFGVLESDDRRTGGA